MIPTSAQPKKKATILHPFCPFLIGGFAFVTTGYIALVDALDRKERYGHLLSISLRHSARVPPDCFPLSDAGILLLLEIIATVVGMVVLWLLRRRARHQK